MSNLGDYKAKIAVCPSASKHGLAMDQLIKADAEISALKSKLEAAERERTEAQAEIARLNESIVGLNAELDDYDAKGLESLETFKHISAALAAAEARAKEAELLLEQAAAVMSESGDGLVECARIRAHLERGKKT